jgi:hypothetical protein
MATSPNKGYELQVTGTNVDTWGQILNDQVFSRIDANLGGTVTKSLTNAQVDLNAEESRNLRLILTGTLTSNVLVTTQAVGMTIIDNQCTGNFQVTFQKNGVGSPILLPNGTVNLVTTGASGNPKTVGVDFPTGTRMLFGNPNPPAGWSKDTAGGINNSAIRLVTDGSGGSQGGSADFTATFASRGLSGSVGNTTLTIAQIPAHSHTIVAAGNDDNTNHSPVKGTENSNNNNVNTSSVGGGEPHGHSLTMNNLDMAVRYYNACWGIKL